MILISTVYLECVQHFIYIASIGNINVLHFVLYNTLSVYQILCKLLMIIFSISYFIEKNWYWEQALMFSYEFSVSNQVCSKGVREFKWVNLVLNSCLRYHFQGKTWLYDDGMMAWYLNFWQLSFYCNCHYDVNISKMYLNETRGMFHLYSMHHSEQSYIYKGNWRVQWVSSLYFLGPFFSVKH